MAEIIRPPGIKLRRWRPISDANGAVIRPVYGTMLLNVLAQADDKIDA